MRDSSSLRRKRRTDVPKGIIYEGFVATRCGTMNSHGVNTFTMSRRGHVAVCDIFALKMILANFALESLLPGETTQGAATWTASIEYPSGQFSQVTFSGNPLASTAAGATITSDLIRPPLMIPRGGTFWTRLWQSAPSGVLYSSFCDTSIGDQSEGGTSGITDRTMGGSITNLTGTGRQPMALVGMTDKASYVLEGDSIIHGLTDTSTINDFRTGIIAKAFPADTYAFVNVGSDGLYASDLMTKSVARQVVYQYCSDFISERGVNDMYPGARSEAQLWADLRTIWATLKPRTRVQQLTLTPETTSAGNVWLADSDQTVVTGNTTRVAFNTTLRAGNVANITSMFDTCTAFESSLNSGKIIGDGVTVKKYTNDGIHPNPAGYNLQSAYVPPTYP